MQISQFFGTIQKKTCNFVPEMKYNTHTLSNGLRIIHLPSTSDVVYCGYEINGGTRHETADDEGLAHFLNISRLKAPSDAMPVISSIVWRALVAI